VFYKTVSDCSGKSPRFSIFSLRPGTIKQDLTLLIVGHIVICLHLLGLLLLLTESQTTAPASPTHLSMYVNTTSTVQCTHLDISQRNSCLKSLLLIGHSCCAVAAASGRCEIAWHHARRLKLVFLPSSESDTRFTSVDVHRRRQKRT